MHIAVQPTYINLHPQGLWSRSFYWSNAVPAQLQCPLSLTSSDAAWFCRWRERCERVVEVSTTLLPERWQSIAVLRRDHPTQRLLLMSKQWRADCLPKQRNSTDQLRSSTRCAPTITLISNFNYFYFPIFLFNWSFLHPGLAIHVQKTWFGIAASANKKIITFTSLTTNNLNEVHTRLLFNCPIFLKLQVKT